MTRKPPSATLVVDANIILSALRGRATGAHIFRVRAIREVTTSAEAVREVTRVLDRLDVSNATIDASHKLFEALAVADDTEYAAHLAEAAAILASAPASRNGSTADAHILALAWTLDADIWSHDRDFAGTGWPSWSSANLIDALAGEAA